MHRSSALSVALLALCLAPGCDRAERPEQPTAPGPPPAGEGAGGPAEPAAAREAEAEPEPETSEPEGASAAEVPLLGEVIAAHGGEVLEHATVEFDFRGDHFVVWRDGGRFRYERIREEDGERVRDVLSNDGFARWVDGEQVELPPEKAAALRRSVDSVVYFALLPFPLRDPSVRAERLEDVRVKGEPYARLRVTFAAEQGAGEHQDVYMYWFRREGLHMDYLAYKYEGGLRFREAFNRREVGGVRFADFENYGLPEDEAEAVDAMDVPLEGLLDRHLAGELRHVSTVAIENVTVEPHGGED